MASLPDTLHGLGRVPPRKKLKRLRASPGAAGRGDLAGRGRPRCLAA